MFYKLQGTTLRGAAFTSEICLAAILVLLMVENKVQKLDDL
jgi:hypothetical protein